MGGNVQLKPYYREGSAVLTEILVQSTQLMLYKKEYSKAKLLEMAKIYRDMYESEKGFSGEEPLYNSNPNKPMSYATKVLQKCMNFMC